MIDVSARALRQQNIRELAAIEIAQARQALDSIEREFGQAYTAPSYIQEKADKITTSVQRLTNLSERLTS